MAGPTSSPLPAYSSLRESHWNRVRAHYREEPDPLSASARAYRRLLAHYYRLLIPESASVLEIGCGDGSLLEMLPNRRVTGVDLSPDMLERARRRVPHGSFHVMAGESMDLEGQTFDFIILSDTINEAADVQEMLVRARSCATAETRLILNFHNTLWRPVLALAATCGLVRRRGPSNWLATTDVRSLLELSGWEVITTQHRILLPFTVPLLERVFNAFLAPFLAWFCLTVFILARLRPRDDTSREASVTVVIPARNESGNLRAAVERTPLMGRATELIFIEGHSTDDTWETMRRLPEAYPDRQIRVMRQTGKGKGNAVREAFAAATGDILMILDADLTMPPEELPKFYQALVSQKAEFVNGVRLVYPMEDEAMRFLNMCANKLFSLIFSWLLGQPVRDTLCGTKVLYRSDYTRIAANRAYFGDFDPFGDFDLLFGAAKLNLKIVDIPIRYRNRTYGDTNISRWRHGALLFRMVLFASRKLKFL